MKSEASAARTVLAKALNQKADELGDNPTLGITAAWDSLAHMRLILEMESHLDRTLKPMEIVSITTLPDIDSILSSS